MRRSLRTMLAAVMMLSVPITAHAVSLEDLITLGGSITEGDKVFSDFSLVDIECEGTCDIGVIDVTGLSLPGHEGLLFSGDISVGPDSTLELVLAFHVERTDVSMLIHDVAVAFSGDTAEGGSISITESVFDALTFELLGSATVTAPDTLVSTDLSVDVAEGFLVKQISLVGGTEGALITAIGQFVSQAPVERGVPEPVTTLMFGAGALVLGALARRGRRRSS